MEYKLSSVHPDAKIGQNVEIGPFVTIDKDVVIGDGTKIMSGAVICEGTRIGSNCRIFPHAVLGAVPQDLKFVGEYTTCEIGDNNTIREFVTINRGTQSTGRTVIGNNNLLMAYTHVGHDCVLGNNLIISNASQFAGEVHIDDFAVIGGGSLVHQFTHIGSYVMIQGGSKIPKDIPPYVIAGEEPLAYFGLNLVGLRRRGFSNETISAIHDVYRIIYQSGLNISQALAQVMETLPESPERNYIVDFIKNSSRGIIPSCIKKK